MGDGMNKRAVGTAYEKRVGAYLKTQGYEILEYNFRCRSGEIDIVARDGKYLVFVEVKYRRTSSSGNPLEAVDHRKQRTISRTALFYLLKHGYNDTTPCRFDVASVLGEEIEIIKNAFEFCG
jgi:putative endonuclease